MQRLNPTGSLLRARPFVARHDYIFALLCFLNVNMGALNTSATLVGVEDSGGDLSLETVLAQGLLDDMAGVFQEVRTYPWGKGGCSGWRGMECIARVLSLAQRWK